MKRSLFFLVMSAISMCMSAQESFDNVSGTVSWNTGNETMAVASGNISSAVKGATMKAGTDLTVTQSNTLACNSGVTMTLFGPATSKAGRVKAVAVDYTITMKKGLTFTPTAIAYDAVKKGTDNCYYAWTYIVDGVESDTIDIAKENIVRDNNTTGSPALRHQETITATAGQKVTLRFFMSYVDAGKQVALGKVVISGNVNGTEIMRTFKDFKLDFRTKPYTVITPAEGLPEGIVLTGTDNVNGNQHGLNQGATIKVPVDGPVKFTIGNCQYSNTGTVTDRNGKTLATLTPNGACENSVSDISKATYNSFITWTYNVEDADTITFHFTGCYLPYFFAEKCDFVPSVEVVYYDVDGTTVLATDTQDGGSPLVYNAEARAKVTVGEGMAFRGWFNATTQTASKVKEGTPLVEDTKLFAKTTAIEKAEVGTHYLYDLKKQNFYPEDHELLLTQGSFHDGQHGFIFNKGQYLKLVVSPKCYVSLGLCKYSETSNQRIVNAAGDSVSTMSVVKETTPDGALCSFYYENPKSVQDTLIINFTTTTYIHQAEVYNVAAPIKKDGHKYTLAAGDGASLMMLLGQLQDGDSIYLPNGTYDFGESVLNTVSANNIVIMGESMDGVIIRNAPDYTAEGISTTATILNTGTGNKFENLTIQNAMDYYTAMTKQSSARAVCLHDKGTKTICHKVKMLSYQDTYYSNNVGALHYFEDCEIHGTVDFICGDGSAYFYNCLLYAEKRKAEGGGSDALTASNATNPDKGYVFDRCTVKSECPLVSLGRSWNNQPRCVYLLTTFDNSGGEFSVTGSGIERWTLAGMNSLPEYFAEYRTLDTEGNVISPNENTITFTYNGTKEMNTIINYEEALTHTYPNFFKGWDPAINYVPFPDDPTGIKGVGLTPALSTREGVTYNLMGQKINSVKKGDIFILKGNKYLKK